jgi:uncharacterized oligopeptide transporter (OPT) family protein
MAPDRGNQEDHLGLLRSDAEDLTSVPGSEHPEGFTIEHPEYAKNGHFTFRGVVVGLAIGIIICFSNTYFGLQTGWISGMAMPSALLGFSYFRLVSRLLSYPFTPVENVLVQSVAGSVGTMPLGCGFVGVIPALNFLLKSEENGPLNLSLTKLIVWALGIAFFGVVFAVPLRRQVILREQLKFPSGTAAAALIALLHGKDADAIVESETLSRTVSHELPQLTRETSRLSRSRVFAQDEDLIAGSPDEWAGRIRFLLLAFGFSAFYVSIQRSPEYTL